MRTESGRSRSIPHFAVADADRPESTNSLEVQRGMIRIRLEQLVVLPREFLTVDRELVQAGPELGRSEMLHMPLVSPRSCAARASAANRSSLPEETSRSICRSQTS